MLNIPPEKYGALAVFSTWKFYLLQKPHTRDKHGSGPQFMELQYWHRSGPQLTELPYWYKLSNGRTAKVQVLNWLNCLIGTGHWLSKLPRFKFSVNQSMIRVQVINWENSQGSGLHQTQKQCWYRLWIKGTAMVQVLNWQNCHTGTGHRLKELPWFRSWRNRYMKLVPAIGWEKYQSSSP